MNIIVGPTIKLYFYMTYNLCIVFLYKLKNDILLKADPKKCDGS